MAADEPQRVTRLLHDLEAGDRRAADELLPLVYHELRRLARSRMAREQGPQTLTPTALVHEAYLRLVRDQDFGWENRGHFFAAAAEAMRRLLIERARRQARQRHGGGRQRVSLAEAAAPLGAPPEELLALDEALSRLEALDNERATVVKLRFFSGLTVAETAAALGVSERSVHRQWEGARAWLQREMTRTPPAVAS